MGHDTFQGTVSLAKKVDRSGRSHKAMRHGLLPEASVTDDQEVSSIAKAKDR